MTRSCTFQMLVYTYASNIEYRKEKKEEEQEKVRRSERETERERERQSNHYHTVDCHANVRRTITRRKRNERV